MSTLIKEPGWLLDNIERVQQIVKSNISKEIDKLKDLAIASFVDEKLKGNIEAEHQLFFDRVMAFRQKGQLLIEAEQGSNDYGLVLQTDADVKT